MASLKDITGLFTLIAGPIVFLLLTAVPVFPQSAPHSREYEIKAAFLFNFARLTEWPVKASSSSGKEFEICVLGDDPFGKDLDPLAGRTVGGRTVSITRIKDINESSGCNLLFVASSEKHHLWEIMAHVRNMPILTVSDIEGFETKGGIIAFYIKDGHVRFRINTDTARQSHLGMSSHLLEGAEIVSNGRGH